MVTTDSEAGRVHTARLKAFDTTRAPARPAMLLYADRDARAPASCGGTLLALARQQQATAATDGGGCIRGLPRLEKQQKHAPKRCHRRANKRSLPAQSAHRSRGIRDSSIVCISIESAAPPIAPPICMIAPMPTPPSVASAATLTPPEAATRAHPLQATGATPGPLATRSRRLQLRANRRARPPSSGRC